MNTTSNRIRNILAGLVLVSALVAFPAQAEAKSRAAQGGDRMVSLQTAIRMQMEQSQQNILAEQRYKLKHATLLLDNPDVTVGPLEVIETAGAEQNHERPVAVRVETDKQVLAALAEDLMAKALRAPGLMGVSRYITLTALELALEPAE